jgi:ABC-type transport system involved in multi-copper enzyme maturation permease subunit
VAGELLKVGRLRPVRAAIAFALVVALPALATVAGTTPHMRDGGGARAFDNVLYALEALFLSGAFPFLIALSAALVAMEYGHGTVRVLLGRGAGRTRLLAAKMLALGVVALGLLSVFAALATLVFWPAMLIWHVSPAAIVGAPWPDLGLALATTSAAMVVAIVAGAAAGVVGRSVAAAFVIFTCFFTADSLLLPLATRGVSANVSLGVELTKLLVYARLPALAGGLADVVQAVAVVSVWLAALLALSYHLLRTRDVLE